MQACRQRADDAFCVDLRLAMGIVLERRSKAEPEVVCFELARQALERAFEYGRLNVLPAHSESCVASRAGLQHQVEDMPGRNGCQLRLVLDVNPERASAHRLARLHPHALCHGSAVFDSGRFQRPRIIVEIIRQTVETLAFRSDLGAGLRARIVQSLGEMSSQHRTRSGADRSGSPLEFHRRIATGIAEHLRHRLRGGCHGFHVGLPKCDDVLFRKTDGGEHGGESHQAEERHHFGNYQGNPHV